MLGAHHIFVLAAPGNVIAAGKLNSLFGDGFIDCALGPLNVGADVDAFHIHVDPCVGHRAFAFDAHWGAHDIYLGELAQRNLCTARSRHDDLAQGFQILAEIAIIAQVDGVAFEPLNGGGQRHAAKGDFEYLLHVAQREPVAGDRVAVDVELDVITPHHALRKHAGGAGHLPDNGLDLFGDTLKLGEIGTGDLNSHRRLNAGGKHVDARFYRHRPGIVHAGNLNCGVHRGDQLVRRAPPMGDDLSRAVLDVHFGPLIFGLEHNGSFDHVERRWIGGALGAADLAKNVMHFGKGLDDFVRHLDNLARFGGRYSWEKRRHIEEVAFVERRHKLGAEILKWESFAETRREAFQVPFGQPLSDQQVPREEHPHDHHRGSNNHQPAQPNDKVDHWMVNPDEESVDRVFLLGKDLAPDEVAHQDRRERNGEHRSRGHGVSFGKRKRFEQAAFLRLQSENRDE